MNSGKRLSSKFPRKRPSYEILLPQALHGFDDCHFEMQLFVGHPFMRPFSSGKLIDEFEQRSVVTSSACARVMFCTSASTSSFSASALPEDQPDRAGKQSSPTSAASCPAGLRFADAADRSRPEFPPRKIRPVRWTTVCSLVNQKHRAHHFR